MKICQLSAAGLLLLSAGCVSKQELRCANQALERENFHLEECLSQARYEADDLRAELEICRQQRDGTPLSNSAPTPAPSERGPGLRATPTPALPPRDAVPPAHQDDVDRAPSIVLPDEERSASGASMPRERAAPFDGPPIISPPNPRVPEGRLPRAIEARAIPESETAVSSDLRMAPAAEEIESLPDSEPPPRGEASGSGNRTQQVAPEQIAPPGAGESSSNSTPDTAPTARLIAKKSENGDRQLNMMAVNPTATYWKKSSGAAAKPDELLVVVEPRNAAGEVIEVSGDVSVALLDPTQDGKNARVARWDFAADQLATHFKGSRAGGGLHFRLAWPGEPPKVDRLELYVRLTLADGRQFVAESVLEANAAPATAPAADVAGQAIEPGWHRAPNGPAPAALDNSQRPPQNDRLPTAAPRSTRWQTYR